MNKQVTPLANTKPRLEFIDAMRGVLAFGVVLVHVIIVSFKSQELPHIINILESFYMPLFFMISGYLGFKLYTEKTFGKCLELIKGKFKALFIPSIFIGLLRSMYNHEFRIYWFTLALFVMFCIYYCCYFVAKKQWQFYTLYITIAVALVLFDLYDTKAHLLSNVMGETNYRKVSYLIVRTMLNLPFFILGNMAKRYQQQFYTLLDSSKVRNLLLLFYISVFYIFYVYNMRELTGGWHASFFLTGFSGAAIGFAFFYRNKLSFAKESTLGSALQYMGRRSIDIYFLHIFFLMNLPELNELLNKYPSGFIAFTIEFLLSIVIVLLCLLFSKVLCLSPFVEKWLFGRTQK